MQTLRQAVRHTVHGAVGAPKKGVDRAVDLATKRANAPSEHKALFRNLLFHSMSATRTFAASATDLERMTFMGAWALLCEKVTQKRTMVWNTLTWQWRFCRAMIRISGKLRAHHRIHQPGQGDYYARVLAENKEYWADVQLHNGTLADRNNFSKVAKLARHVRYVRKEGNAVYREKYYHVQLDHSDSEGSDDWRDRSDSEGSDDKDIDADLWERRRQRRERAYE